MNERPTFEPHEAFDRDFKGDITRKVFIEFVRNSHDHMIELERYIKRYDLTFDEYITQWDGNLESLDDDIVSLLHEWIEDGTFADIINEDLFKTKADQVDLENVTAQLAQTDNKKLNRNENESISMAMLDSGIKKAINDGTWEVNVNTSEIEDKAVTRRKTDFIIPDTTINKFDGVYKKDMGIDFNNNTLITSEDRKVALIPVLPNTTYTIRKEDVTDVFLIKSSTNDNLKAADVLDGAVSHSWSGEVISRLITTGPTDRTLIVQFTTTGKEPYMEVTEGNTTGTPYKLLFNDYQNTVRGLDTYTRAEVNQLVNEATPQGFRVVKSGDNFNIYMHSHKGSQHIHYRYGLSVDSETNLNQWKLRSVNIVDDSYSPVYNMVPEIEWEGVFRENGATDFIGGVHGDEVNTHINILLDGEVVDVYTSDFTKDNVEELKIVNKSILNRMDEPTTDVAERTKVTTWKNKKMTVENKWTFLVDTLVLVFYPSMMSLRREDGDGVISHLRSNSVYDISLANSPEQTGGAFDNTQDATYYEMWGETTGAYFKHECIIDTDKYPARKSFATNDQYQMIKSYFDLGPMDAKIGDVVKSKSIYTITV